MLRFRTSLLIALLCGTAVSASAGTVYVPFATDSDFGGAHYQTQVWISNSGTLPRRIDSLFFENGVDGTVRPGLQPSSTRVVNNSSFLIRPLAPAGKTGILEITGAEVLAVSARLVSGGKLGASLPIVSSANLVAAGTAAELQGLQRDATRFFSIVGVLNLGHTATSCDLQILRSSGQSITTAKVTVAPLSQRVFDDVLAPETAITSARMTVSCDQPFFPFAVTFDRQLGTSVVSGPSASTDSTLGTPGGGPVGALCGAVQAGRRCFDKPGLFFSPSRSAPTLRIVLPFPRGVEYTKVRVQEDVTHGGWFAKRPDGIHNFFWLAQGTNVDRIGYANARGPNRNLIYAVHHIGAPKDVEAPRLEGNVALQQGQTYHIDYTYDAKNRLVTYVVSNSAGQVLVSDTNTNTFTRRIFTTSVDYLLDIGLHDEAADAPTFGWKYSNLKVEFFND
jgi:hypothetical protein